MSITTILGANHALPAYRDRINARHDVPGVIQCLGSTHGDNFAFYHGDTCEVLPQIPANSVDLIIYSPPFSSLYTYTDSPRDMGNCTDDAQFFEHYGWLVGELLRVLRPGRMAVVHCTDIPSTITHHGLIGLRDFSGDIIKAHMACPPVDVIGSDGTRRSFPWIYHSRTTVWKDPVVEMQRTKALGLLHKQIKKDSTRSRCGLPDYLLSFRKGHEAHDPRFGGAPVTHTNETFPVERWQQWASSHWPLDVPEEWGHRRAEEMAKATAPVWRDIDQTRTLNVRQAREDGDERHMCPLQLDVIERLVKLWSNPGEVVLSPFGGVGSEGVGSLTHKRRFVGVELKESYFNTGSRNLLDADNTRQVGLFG